MNRLLDVDPRRLREGRHRRRWSPAARRRSIRSTRRCARSATRSRRCSTSTACACSSPTSRRATRALGALHELYKPIPGKFKDYIAIPKANGYQSLHTTLFGPFGTPLEAQIRTHDMHRVAEAGVAAHWLYKAGGQLDLAEAQRETHRWLQSLLEIQSESRDSKEFLEHVKVDLFPDEIYVFTPKGKIMALPRGATAVDFAYARAHRHRPPLRRGADQLRAAAAAHRAQERRPRRDPHVADRAAESVVAVVRRHRQGALAHPALPEGPAAEGIGRARRAAAEPGAGDAEGRARSRSRGIAGKRCRRNTARRASSRSSPTSASASGCRSSSRRR